MNFPELSYKLHAEHRADHGTMDLGTYRNWFESGTVDLWRHLRMFNQLDPFLEQFKGASWLTLGDGTYGTAAIYVQRMGSHSLPVQEFYGPRFSRILTTPTVAMWVWGRPHPRRSCMCAGLFGSKIPMGRVRYRSAGPREERAFRSPAAPDIRC